MLVFGTVVQPALGVTVALALGTTKRNATSFVTNGVKVGLVTAVPVPVVPPVDPADPPIWYPIPPLNTV
jgi:hypothetical protein